VPATVILYGKNIEINYTAESDSNGAYIVENVVPGDYGIVYDFLGFRRDMNTTISVEPSKPASQDIPIPTGEVRGVAAYPNGNHPSRLEIRMYALDSHNEFNFTTDENGAYYLSGVIPGVYQIDAVSDNLTTSNTRFGIMDNYTSTTNFTVYPATTISGYVTLSGKAVPYVNVNFINYTKEDVRRSAMTDSNGYFSTKVAKGRYTIYATHLSGSSEYAVLEQQYLVSETSVNLNLKKCYSVSGYIKYSNHYKDRFPVTFVAEDGARVDFYSVEGNYSASLPEGAYHVYVSHAFATFPYSYTAHISVPATKSLDIDLIKGAEISGHINGVENMPVPDARVIFESSEGSFETFSDMSGSFRYYLVPGNYTLDVSAPGYDHMRTEITAVEGDSMMQNLSLVAMQNTVKGTVYLDDTPISGINISFYGYNRTYNTSTDENGNYSISLYGGSYGIIVSQDTDESGDEKYQLTSSQYIYVDPYADEIMRDLQIERRFRVSGNLSLDGSPVNNTRIYFSRVYLQRVLYL